MPIRIRSALFFTLALSFGLFSAPLVEIEAFASFAFQVPEGRLVKGSGPRIYLVDTGRRRLIPNETTIEALDVGPIIQLGNAELNAIPLGSPYPTLPGPLIQSDAPLPVGTEPEVFFVQSGKRRLIPDRNTLYSLDLGDVISIPDADLRSITLWAAFPKLPGSLIKGTAAEVYQIQQGKRRLVPYSQGVGMLQGVKTVPDNVLNSLPLGTPYQSVSSNAPAQLSTSLMVCWFRNDEFGRPYSQTFGHTGDNRHNQEGINGAGAYSLSDPSGRIYEVIYNCQGPHCGWSSNPDGGYHGKVEVNAHGSSFSWRRSWGGHPVGETYTAKYEVPRKILASTCPAGSHP